MDHSPEYGLCPAPCFFSIDLESYRPVSSATTTTPNMNDLEKGNDANGHGSGASRDSHINDLQRLETTQTMSPELFERLYLQPKIGAASDLSKRLGNPTPIALMGTFYETSLLDFLLTDSLQALRQASHPYLPSSWAGEDLVAMPKQLWARPFGLAACCSSSPDWANSCWGTQLVRTIRTRKSIITDLA